MSQTAETERWAARPVWAAVIRAFAFLVPIAASVVFVNLASRIVAAPTGSLWLFIGWWILLSASATGVLLLVDQLSRRLLPLAALFKLSLVFPDRAPSRFETAMQTNTVQSLETRVAEAKASGHETSVVEAAQRLLGLVATLDQHDRLTRGHCERVRAYAQMIAQDMRLGQADRDLLNWAALLHDVGKLGVPSEILTKPGKPTDEEWAALKRHPEIGEELVAPLKDWLGEWAAAVGDHHERWDGRGYPRGKTGKDISLAGRIVAVADVFDVITSARSYKSAWSTAQARSELASHAGTQFDDRVVRAFLNVSLGRLRLIMGPLSLLAHAPILARMPLTPAVSALSGTVAAIGAAAGIGLVETPAPPTVKPQLIAVTARGAEAGAGAERPYPRPGRRRLARAQNEQARRQVALVAPEVEWIVDEDTEVVVPLRRLQSPETIKRLRIIEPPQFGTAMAASRTSIAYRPPTHYSGTTSLGYEACWRGSRCAVGLVLITVQPVNDLPQTVGDQAATDEDTPVWIDPLGNDSDVESPALTLVAAWAATAGETTVADGRVAWRPPPDFDGTASFLYAAGDADGGTSVDRVTVHVVPANDAPVIRPDAATTREDTPVRVELLDNDVDVDDDPLTVLAVDSPASGTVAHDARTATFTPKPNASGRVSFGYIASDRQGGTTPSTVAVTVTPVNDAPAAVADDAAVFLGRTVEIEPLANDADVEGDTLSLHSAGPPTAGSLTVTGNRVRFTPPSDPGTVTFPYQVRDAEGATATATVTVTVKGINSAPSFVAGPDQTANEDGGPQAAAWAGAISPGRSDEAGQTVSFTVTATNPTLFTSGGQPTLAGNGVLTYTPALNAHGSSTLTIRAHDDGGTEHGGIDTGPARTATITITPVNDGPSVALGSNQTVAEDAGPQAVPGWATGFSPGPPDEASQTVTATATTPHASLFTPGGQPAVAANGTLTYTPAANATGVATLTIHAHDSGGTANGGIDTGPAQTRTLTITPLNDPPVAVPDAAAVNEDDGSGVTFSVLANDTDPDGDAVTLASFDGSSVAEGTLTHTGSGNFRFVPDAGFNGVQSFSYTVSDGQGGSDSAGVTISVTAQPDAPIAADDAYATAPGVTLVQPAPGVLANDGDEDGDSLSVQTAPVIAPANGTVVLAANGAFTYAPNPAFVGTDSFSYRVADGTGRTDDAEVTITVASGMSTSLFYLGTSGPSADVWDLTTTLQPAASPVPDFDGDGSPGLSILSDNGGEGVTDSPKWQAWARTVVGQPLVLNGPVRLRLWSTSSGFDPDDDQRPHVYLYDCLAGGTGCAKIASTHTLVENWNGGASTWVFHEITVGSVNRTIAVGRELRVRVQTSKNDLWVAMTASYPSALAVTGP